jgi:rhomboid protease GluP
MSTDFPPLPPGMPAPPGFSSLAVFRRDLFAATPVAWVAPLLVAANVIWFAAVTVIGGVSLWDPDAQAMVHWGAGFGPLTAGGQSWRLLSEIFVHFGILHLAFNMIVLWQVGPLVERLFGNIAFAVIYFLSGLCGSLLSARLHPLSVAGGASGAIFGLYGALFGFLLVQRRSIPGPILKTLAVNAAIFVGYNVIAGASQPGIDMSAHGGGLAGGWILGMLLSRKLLPGAGSVRAIAVAVLGGAAVVWTAGHLPQVADAEAEWQKMAAVDTHCIDIYNKAVGQWNKRQISPEEFASILETQVLPPYRQARAALQSVKYPLPDRSQWDKQLQYTAKRQEQWEAMARAARDGSDQELDKANQLNTEADDILKSIGSRK